MTSISTVPDYGLRARRWWPTALALAGVIGTGAYALNWYVSRPVVTSVVGTYFTVVPMDLAISIKKDGDLQAVNNIDIICDVEGTSRIQTIVKEARWSRRARS